MLILSPTPHPTESLLGYLLRLAEANGYDYLGLLYGQTEMPAGKRYSIGLDTAALAPLVGLSAEALAPYAYSTKNAEGDSDPLLNGHKVPVRGLRLASPKICPHCIAEKGFIEAHFDLTALVACPDHGHWLLSACPQCGAPLMWSRLGLLKCKCGCDFTEHSLPEAEPALLDLMHVLKCKVLNLPLGEVSKGLPVEHLEGMSLWTLLSVINKLGRYESDYSKLNAESLPSQIATAAEALADWPKGLYRLLEQVGERRPSVQSLGYRKQFEQVFSSLFKNILYEPSEVAFLRDAVLGFGATEWGEAVLDKKLKGLPVASRFLSTAELAKELGLMRSTVKQLIADGKIEAKAKTNGKTTRYITDITTLALPRKAEGKTYGQREAAAFVGLPVSVLLGLRASGDFEERVRSSREKTFHEIDLRFFIQKVKELALEEVDCPELVMTLADVMQLKFRSDDGKTKFMRALLSEAIPLFLPWATTEGDDYNLESLTCLRRDAEAFLLNTRAETSSGTRSAVEAAEQLGSDPETIKGLVNAGELTALDGEQFLRIEEASLADFDKRYVALAVLAKRIGSSSRRLTRLCRVRGLPLLEISRGKGKSLQPFLSRSLEHEFSGLNDGNWH